MCYNRYSAAATIFLVTAAVGSANHLTWDQVLMMNRRQVGFESHTVHHYDLTTLPNEQLVFELQASKRMIEDELGNLVTQVAIHRGCITTPLSPQRKRPAITPGGRRAAAR
jgi:peptidoglycan/xylan/chitin deacetylase (PgdA/CDA1 family)